ncbi:MAG: carboxylating nicotinate-nucleotide diphosphorylase [bacterium]|nr:carboxylating nicotinate-nucleotide diphosphorylase [bacterium]
MDRKPLREFTHKADTFLTIDNSTYKQWVFRYTFLELEKDLGVMGDITTNTVFPDKKEACGHLVAKADGVFAGEEEIRYFLVEADAKFRPSIKGRFELDFKVKDGDSFRKGDVLLEIKADVHDLLAVERVVVNFIMRMSSIATLTKRIVDKVSDYDVLITPTRKTLWGLIDKRACIIGGGGSHRLNLSDAILVKDNHIDLVDRDFGLLLQRISESNVDTRFVEIEVRTIEDVLLCAKAFYAFLGEKLRTIGVLLIDNMDVGDVARAIDHLKEAGLYDNLLLEASGGINEDSVLDYAQTGVDIISMGCLTYGVPGVDMSLRVK